MSELWVIYALIVGAVLLGAQAGFLIFRSRKTEAVVNRRLVLSADGASPTAVLDTLRRERGFADYNSAFLKSLSDYWTQTGLRFDRDKLIFACFALGAAYLILFSVMMGFSIFAPLFAILAAAGSVVLFLRSVRKKRIARFGEQLPDAIEVIVRGVKVGFPFSSALTLVAKEMSDPIGTEFGMTADEITFGLDIRAALENLFRRVGQEDLLFLIIAISVQSQTGGRLADVLSRLAQLIRQRATLRLKVMALSAEGRLSAVFLSLMPFVLIGIITLISPNYYGSIVSSPALLPAIGVGLSLLLIGNFVMYRMVHFKF